jgi:hypothetical protein
VPPAQWLQIGRDHTLENVDRGRPINAPPALPCHGLRRVFGLVSSSCARAVNESTCIGLDKTSG